MPLIPPMIRTSSSHTRANTTNIFLVGTKKYTAPFPYPGFPCKPHGLLPTGSNFYLSRNTRSYALLPEYSEPCFFCNDHSARSRAFSRRTRDHAPSPRRSDRAFPEALGPYFFPKHSYRTFFRSTRTVLFSEALGPYFFPKHSDRAFSRRTRDHAPFPKRSEPCFFCNDHSALNATRHKTRIFYLNTKLRLSQTTAVI